jgi:hypothetical protein
MCLSHPAFYAAGGFAGIMGSGGVICSPLARPYLHFAYNVIVIVPMFLALWDQARGLELELPVEVPDLARMWAYQLL